MLDLLAQPEFRIFTVMGTVVIGLLVLEIALMLIGLNSQFGEPDMDIDVDVDVDLGAEGMAALDGIDSADLVDIEPLGVDALDGADSLDAADALDGLDSMETDILSEAQSASASSVGVLDMLGVTKVPSAIWLAALLTFLSIFGFMLQGAIGIFGLGYLPSAIVMAIICVPALFVTARFARFVGGLIPGIETSAVGAHAFHKRRGVISGGTASANRAAEVKWVDGYGNTHYLMAEPLDQKETITQGADVLILRTRDKQAKIVAL